MMKTYTISWINLLGIILVVALATLLIFNLAQAHQIPITSVGWHELASVGWVTTPA
jgi:hypothetical protein